MKPLLLRRSTTLLLVALAAVSVIVEAESPGDKKLKSPTQSEATKAKGHPSQPLRAAQRGRKKNIWSYKPGHRSLAFLKAGEVMVVTAPPVGIAHGSEYRCLGCCVAGGTHGGITDRALGNRLGKSVRRTVDYEEMGVEPNSISDRCLGCCDEDGTPTPEEAGKRTGKAAAGTERVVGKETANRQSSRPLQRNNESPCVQQDCAKVWSSESQSSESQSSSEESTAAQRTRAVMEHRKNSQLQPRHHRTGGTCRHLGCRSTLGSFVASSSEED